MKFAILFAVVALATIVYALPKPEDDKYTTKYDNIDVDSILANDRLLKNYIECVEGVGKCTAEGDELKRNLKDAIQNCCEKCSDKQKDGVKKVFKHLEEKKPEVMKKLKAEHDPEGVHEKECKETITA